MLLQFFFVALFEAVFMVSAVDFLAISRSFWLYLLLKLSLIFLAKARNPYPFTYILSLGSIEYLNFIRFLYLSTIVKFSLNSISNGWLFWSVIHTLISSYCELNVFKKIWFVGEISISYQNVCREQKYKILLNLVDNHY